MILRRPPYSERAGYRYRGPCSVVTFTAGGRRRLSAWRAVLTPLAEQRLKFGDARVRPSLGGFRLAACGGFVVEQGFGLAACGFRLATRDGFMEPGFSLPPGGDFQLHPLLCLLPPLLRPLPLLL